MQLEGRVAVDLLRAGSQRALDRIDDGVEGMRFIETALAPRPDWSGTDGSGTGGSGTGGSGTVPPVSFLRSGPIGTHSSP